MKRGVKITLIVVISIIILLVTVPILYKHFVPNRIMDWGGMENPDKDILWAEIEKQRELERQEVLERLDGLNKKNDSKADLDGIWVLKNSGRYEITVTVKDGRFIYCRNSECLYDGGYTLDNATALITLTDAKSVDGTSYFAYCAGCLIAFIFVENKECHELEFVRKL